MKGRAYWLMWGVIFAVGLILGSAGVFAETVEINTAQTSMQDLEALSGGRTKTALVTSSGSVNVSSGTDPAIWGKTDGWTVTVLQWRTVSGGIAGINFNDQKDASGNDLQGVVINDGTVTGSGTSNYIFGVNSGAWSIISNSSSGTISGTTSGNYGVGVFTGNDSKIYNSGTISGYANSGSYGVYGSDGITVRSDGVILATSAASNSFGVRGGSNTTVVNSGTISASSLGSTGYGVYTGSNSAVTNEDGGKIIVSVGGDYAYGIRGATNVTNDGMITVSGASYVHGILPAGGATVINDGVMTITATNGPTNGIAAVNGTVTNTGVITVSGTNLATYGLNMTGTTGSSVTNSGEITVTASGSSGFAYGVYMSKGSIVNQSGGTISATGLTGAYGVSIDTGTVTNASGAAITGSGTGVQMTGASTLNNYGVISGAIGVASTGGNAIIRNYGGGTITGTAGVALSVAGDNNTVLIQENSTINGSIEAVGAGNSLEFNGPGTYPSNITGTWALMKSGSGTLVLNGTNTYTGGTTVSEGVLQGDTISLQGNILNYGQVTFHQTSDGTYAGVISGTGSLSKDATGLLILTGDHTYTGATTIHAGALAVNGSLTSPVTVDAAGTLMGTGTVAGSVVNSGVIAPGQSIGTLTVNGHLTFAAGSTYQVEANAAGQSDKTVVSGTTTISGDQTTVSVLAESGSYAASTQYTILTSTGGVTGTFADVTSNLAFLTPSLSYDATNIYLTLTQNSKHFVDVALTRNQHAVAAGLDRIASSVSGDMSAVMTGLRSLSEEGAQRALNRTGGLTHPALAEASTFVFQQYLNVLSDRMKGVGQTSATFAGLTHLAALGHTASDATHSSAPAQGGWMKGYGSLGNRNGEDVSSKYGYRAGSIALGYDRTIGHKGFVGLSAGYSAARLSMDQLDDKADVSIYSAALYGGYCGTPWYVHGALAYGYNRYDTRRHIVFGDVDRTADATYTGHTVSGYVEAGYPLEIQTLRVTPLASLSAAYLMRDAFTEEGAGALNLMVDKERSRSLTASLGARVKRDFKTVAGTVTPEASVRWQHEFLDTDYSIDAAFNGYSSSAFTVQTDSAARDSAAIELGVAWAIRENLDLAAQYAAVFSADRSQHVGAIGMRLRW